MLLQRNIFQKRGADRLKPPDYERFKSSFESAISSYRNNPYKFLEEYCGVTLRLYQKILMNIILYQRSDLKLK